MKYLSSGNTEEWQSGNLLLYNIASFRKVMALNYDLD